MKIEAIDTTQPSLVAAELAATYGQTMAMVRRPTLGDVLRIDGGTAKVVSIAKGGVTIEVEDAQGNRKTLSREPTGWWTRA